MKYSSKVKTINSYYRDIDKGNIVFDHKVQRKAGQWSRDQKSEFIKTLLEEALSIPPISLSAHEGKVWVIDGKQRLLAITEFLEENYALSKGMVIYDEGKKIEVGGLKYGKLPIDLRGKIFDTELISIEYTDCDYQDEVRIFNVLNNGTPLTKAQKMRAKIDPDVLDKLDEVVGLPFFDKLPFSASSIRKGDDIVCVAQSLILLDDSVGNTLLAKKVEEYLPKIDEKAVDNLKKVLTDLGDVIGDEELSSKGAFKRVNFPMVVAGAALSKDEKAYYEKLKKFDEGYEKNTAYKKFLDEGTSREEKVTGRFEYFKKNLIS